MKRKHAATLPGTLLVLLSASLLIASANGGPTVNWWVITGGSAPSSGGGISLNNIGPAGDRLGDRWESGLVDGYWSGAGVAATLAVTDLRGSRISDGTWFSSTGPP